MLYYYLRNQHYNYRILIIIMTPNILDMAKYFNKPTSRRQKQYEAVRAIIVDKISIKIIAKKFGYKNNTVYALLRDAKAKKIELFPAVQKGPSQKRTSSDIQKQIIAFRHQGFSIPDIYDKLSRSNTMLSTSTIERILKNAGFGKLKRRTNKELGKTTANKIIPERSSQLDFEKLESFNIDCPIAGIFFFIPYILESKILDIVKECKLPESSDIGSVQACLSILLLKLIGGSRLSHIGAYDQEPGLGVFAGLNILPKSTYMNTYSCRTSEAQLMALQNRIISSFKNQTPAFYKSNFINLDFHSIPHYGDESEMEKIWCGARGKAMKGANTVFAQDSNSNAIVYTRADILRSEEAIEVKNFVDYWKQINGNVYETLVFDCKFTSYKILDDLENDKIKFITLRKRHDSLIQQLSKIPDDQWKKVYVPIPKRKYKHVSVYEKEVKLKGNKNTFRQMAIRGHGRSNPTFILTNNRELTLNKILEVYAKRWHVENKLAELVAFFNLNALSSPIMIRIHFDILWTIIADTLYHQFANDLRRFEKTLSPQIFRRFINMPGRVIYDGNKFVIKIRKRSYTPILKEVKKLQYPFSVPWLSNKSVEIIWTQ